MLTSKKALPLIVISQFLCTSLWFAGNGVSNDIISSFNLNQNTVSYLITSVQFGFIFGTLLFALLFITDRFSPSTIFFVCSLLGATFNLGILLENNTLTSLVVFRFLTGFSLAGIYPVGMKIAADYFNEGLGKSLSWLVGALVLGTAFPHFLKLISGNYSWTYVIFSTSILAVLGGLLILFFIPKGPYYKTNSKPGLNNIFRVFKNKKFSQAAIGYFGHMWELYTFWAFVPIFISIYNSLHSGSNLSIPLFSFIIIGSGSIACIVGGYLSSCFGTKKTATYFLISSGICCLTSPFFFYSSIFIFLSFMIFWGATVIADSPLFSSLIAKNTEPESKGTALTIINCIGFSITIISIQTLSYLQSITQSNYILLILAIGPIFGVINLMKEHKTQKFRAS
ncbi:MFS transporter [Flavicella sp.]|uniref:MFS transporter n=1 Tax=Flavicella sp. TaxID=2957742 RepID=UPI0030172DAE